MATYRPLPNNVTIKKSNIEGLGLFAVENIRKGKVLGLTHYVNRKDTKLDIFRKVLTFIFIQSSTTVIFFIRLGVSL